MRALLLLALLAGCDRTPPVRQTAGDRLEAAAEAAGLIADPTASLTGTWARDTDRACIVAASDGATRIGVLVDYGEAQGCAASGTLERSGGRVRVAFGACRIDARFDGERLTFPAELPSACDTVCTGRASLSALSVERQGRSESEAAMLRAPDGRLLCGA